MDRYTDSFNQHSDVLRDERKRDDFDNLQHTLSGVETGQQTRHGLNKDRDIDPLTGRKRRTVSDIVQDTLQWLLLNNPEYCHAHNQAMETLHRAEQATQSALEKVLTKLRDEISTLEDILLRAAQLPDGTRVFRDERGVVRTEDGSVADIELVATIEFSGNEPSYTDYIASKERINELENAANELRGIETELGSIRGELNENEAPPSLNRIESLTEQIIQMQNRTETYIPNRDHPSAVTAVPIETNLPTASEIPTTNLGAKN